MVFTFLPLTATGKACGATCACARSSRPQLQNTIPVAAAVPPFRKLRRVVIRRPSQDLAAFFDGARPSLARRQSRRHAAESAAQPAVPAVADVTVGRIVEIVE